MRSVSNPRNAATEATQAPVHALAVIVLYQMLPQQSPALQSLQAARNSDPDLSTRISLLVWDNSPGNRQPPAEFENVRYHHDPANPGLCAAYNAALQAAALMGATWLILLDQDTSVTPQYLREALAAAAGTSACALVPRLIHDGTVVSPFHPTAQGPVKPLAPGLRGIAREPLQAFNSGSMLNVRAIQAIGGFDTAFPLDYLDHASFAALQHAKGAIHVLDAVLQHDLSTHTTGALDESSLTRQADILAAEYRFIAKYGTPEQQRMLPLRTARHALSVLVHKHDLHHALLILKTALRSAR